MRAPIPKGSVVSPALLASRARLMRFGPPEPEAVLWRAIRGRQLGVSFRRQVPLLGRYIAGFYAPAVRLVVEVDGAWHCSAAARMRAVTRNCGERDIESCGWKRASCGLR